MPDVQRTHHGAEATEPDSGEGAVSGAAEVVPGAHPTMKIGALAPWFGANMENA